MKTICTLKKYFIGIMVLALIFISKKGFAQPEYSFTGGTLLSGTALNIGAVYRFNNVRPGVDAILTISNISPGIVVTELDGATGYPETIQPTLVVSPWTNGYLEMTIVFKAGGTNTDSVQKEVPITAFDVDGVKNMDGSGNDLHEFDEVNMGGGYVNFNTSTGELSIQQSGNWFTGTNIGGIDYPGRDTSAQQVMFTVFNNNISSLVVRVGVNNQTASSATRLRALYFKKWIYQNGLLALNNTPKLKPVKNGKDRTAFNIFPNNLQGAATIAVESVKGGMAMFEVVDYSGRLMYRQQLAIQKGINNIPFNNVSNISRGSYVAVLKMDGRMYNQKIVKQF